MWCGRRGKGRPTRRRRRSWRAYQPHLAGIGAGRGGGQARRGETPSHGSAEKTWIISFKPRPQLYANANEALPLLRELEDLAPTEVVLDDSALPALTELDPEGAYLAWTVTLHSACEEAAIRDVF